MDERESLAALASFIPFGPKRMELMLEYFGNAYKVWRVDSKELLAVGIKTQNGRKL